MIKCSRHLAIRVFFLAVVMAPAGAGATELWSSYDGTFVLEGWGFWKTQLLSMGFDEDSPLASGDWALQSLSKLRLGGKMYFGDVAVAAEVETRTMLNLGALSGEGDSGLMVGFDSTRTGRGRLWDADPVASDSIGWELDLDRLNVQVPLGPMDLTIGRQAVSWGSAWFWKVTDRFTPFSPFDIDADVKKGVDGVRGEIFLGQTTSLDIVGTVEQDPQAEDWEFGRANAGARLRTTFGRFDLAVSAAWFWREMMVGLEFAGELGQIGFRGEGAFNYSWKLEDWDIEAVVGIDYHLPWKMHMAIELFFNGYGTDDPDEYMDYYVDKSKIDYSLVDLANPDLSGRNLTPDKGERLVRGEAFNIGRYYVGLMMDQELHPLLRLTFSSIVNLRDPSTLLVAGLRWSVVENVRLTAGAMIPIGKKAEAPESVFEMPALGSEFGDFPIVGYVVLKSSF